MNQFQVIVLATPAFLLLMALEFAWCHWRERRGLGANSYRFSDTLNSLSLGVLSQLSGIFTALLMMGAYTAIYSFSAGWRQHDFWSSAIGIVLALLFYDFCYYWLHRAGHRVAIYWAAHVVHHQSQHYNLSTALRQTSSGALLAWVFYAPMALAGVPPMVFGTVALIDLLYQFWVHTEQVGKLGWFDRVFCSPSNHRVHHAVNDTYLDKNYGGILILWDRLFGSFQEEGEACVYGTRSPLNSWDPLWANAEVYWTLLQDSLQAQRWSDKLRVWFKPPGWRPADVAQRFARAEFSTARVQRYDPPVSRTLQWFAGLQFMLLLGCVSVLLWFALSWPLRNVAIWSAALVCAYWTLGGLLQGRIKLLQLILLDAVALLVALLLVV